MSILCRKSYLPQSLFWSSHGSSLLSKGRHLQKFCLLKPSFLGSTISRRFSTLFPDPPPKQEQSEAVKMIRSVLEQDPDEIRKPPTTILGLIGRKVEDGVYFVSFFVAGCITVVLLITTASLFLPTSPQTLYTRAASKVMAVPEVIQILGSPISTSAEPGLRGGDNLTFMEYTKPDGTKIVRFKFYLEGSKEKGICWAEAVKDPFTLSNFNYLSIDIPTKGKRITIINKNVVPHNPM